jgi:hypothetical protein
LSLAALNVGTQFPCRFLKFVSVACRFLNFVSVRRTVRGVALPRLLDTEVRYIRADSEPVLTALGAVDVDVVVRGRPVRRVRSYARERG